MSKFDCKDFRFLIRHNLEHYALITAGSNGAWQKLSLSIGSFTAPSEGRVEVFVANESNIPVWFDDLSIQYQGGIIAQEMHYDPWGLELRGIGKDGKNNFTFNKQSEKQKDLNGGNSYMYETLWRGYDAQLGRFHAADKLASKFTSITPYQFAFNNPIKFNDPTGLEAEGDKKRKDPDEVDRSEGYWKDGAYHVDITYKSDNSPCCLRSSKGRLQTKNEKEGL